MRECLKSPWPAPPPPPPPKPSFPTLQHPISWGLKHLSYHPCQQHCTYTRLVTSERTLRNPPLTLLSPSTPNPCGLARLSCRSCQNYTRSTHVMTGKKSQSLGDHGVCHARHFTHTRRRQMTLPLPRGSPSAVFLGKFRKHVARMLQHPDM